ncbi:MAG: T9SS type A sorting domain-containing protein [Chitinophagaceae bacterium]|nr:T9SS type A sorting domain-containing protein [Chitinophagaceae bacterium]
MGAYGMNATPLPLGLVAFNGQLANTDDVQLQWITENEINVRSFTVEKSVDGISFGPVSELNAKGISGGRTDYALLDKNVKHNLLYYRLKVKETTGELSYSPVITLNRNKALAGTVSPNPVRQGEPLTLSLFATSSKSVEIRIIQTNGQVMLTESIRLKAGKNLIGLQTKGLARGVYVVNVLEME